MKIGMIGFGNMAQAILQGFLLKDLVDPQDVYVCAAHYDALCTRAERYRVHPCKDGQEVIDQSDLILLAIKPYQIEKVVPSLDFCDKRLVSVVAGYDFAALSKLVPSARLLCVIPNTPIAAGEGIVLVEEATNFTLEDKAVFNDLFSKVALIQEVDAAHMTIALILSSSAPAFAEMFLEALGDAGVKYGLPRSQAYALGAKMIEGVGALYLQERKHPGEMKDAVCSPGGMTIKGVSALEKAGFRAAVLAAVEAIEEK